MSEDWRASAAKTFVDTYYAGIASHPMAPEREVMESWLTALQIDKVVYEIGYELANRPNWLHIPLIGFWKLIFDGEQVPA
jgi:maltose alpha-D-glucosyltransferase/alpha-amylase